MKLKPIAIGLVVVLGVGAGIYELKKSRATGYAAADDSETVSSVVSVQTGTLQRMTLHQYVSGYGTVEAAPATATQPAAGAPLAPPAAGVVAKVNVVEGQAVAQGDVLVELNSSTATHDYARAELDRQKQLYAQHNSSLKALQDAETQLALLQVVAPLSGTVTRLSARPGAAVDVSTVVAEVMDLNRLVVSAAIPVADAAGLKTDEEVQILAQPPVTATLTFVSPAVDANSGTILVRAGVPAGCGLRPGQFVPLQIVTAAHTNCLAAPEASVVADVDGHSVIALVNGDQATQAPVQAGFRENGWVEITGDGLKAGAAVVTVGAYGLPDKTKIQIANEAK